jgi:ABC-type glycerol-3-phosphate transport system permease component
VSAPAPAAGRAPGPVSSRAARGLLVHLVLLAVALAVIVPLYWMVKSALGTNEEIFASPVPWLPRSLHPENFPQGLASNQFPRFFLNSFLVAAAVTVTTVVTSALAGYGFAKFEFPGKGLAFAFVLAALMVPFQAIVIPLFILVRELGWLNSYAGLIVPGAVSGFGIFLMRQFMSRVPNELIEAARIDGAGELQVFVLVVLPMARASLASLAVLTFLASWNNFLWPLIVAQKPAMNTVPLGLAQFRGSYFTNYVQLLAVATLAALPVVVLYAFMQRQIVGSFASSGIKG